MIINDIQFSVDLETVLTELQLQLIINQIPLLQKIKDSGDNIMVQCPYHGNGQERRPSAGIRKSDGTFHCFACGETHSLPEVISFCLGYTDDLLGKHGITWLLKNFATVQIEQRNDIVIDCDRKVAQKSNKEFTSYVREEELVKYRYIHPYMYKRKLTDEVIEAFDIGYDRETECITFPVRDINGNCLFVARRSVKTKYFNYPSGIEKPLYGIFELYCCDYPDGYEDYDGLWHEISHFPQEVIVCESMLDALSFWVASKHAVALNGLGSEQQFKQLRDLPCRKLILCTDMDEAGLKARKRIKENVPNKIITEYFLPEGRKDANDCTIDELKNLVDVF